MWSAEGWANGEVDCTMRLRAICRGALQIVCAVALVYPVALADDLPTDRRPTPTWVGTRAGQVRNDNSLKMKLAWCPPGKFAMGSPKDEKDRHDDEGPVRVTLTKGFWIGQYEVTQYQWDFVMETMPWKGQQRVKEGKDFPASYVSWNDAVEFCKKLTDQGHHLRLLPADWTYRLPTEAQWEYACRAGTTTQFSFGEGEARLADYAWFGFTAAEEKDQFARQVGRKKPNLWGLYDMHGNVEEWCRDQYDEKLPGGNDPEVPVVEFSQPALRGGSWFSIGSGCRSARRRFDVRSSREPKSGFRIVAVPAGR
jgi:formylglycine-generating enzyme required for sulfatase activity